MEVTSTARKIDRRIVPLFIESRRSRRAKRTNARSVRPASLKRLLVESVVVLIALTASTEKTLSAQLGQDPSQDVQLATLTAEALQQLVAPIALYPDALVAQILASSTYPDEIVEADRWLQEHSNLKDEDLAEEVDKQSWDPSVKALTEFPSVLSNLDFNLSWTSSLGDAYFNQQQDVLDAIQVLRARAKDAGNLQSNSQEIITNQGSTITIEPTDPDICYVPIYNPLLVYGAPIGIYPGYLYDSVTGSPSISFSIGLRLGGGFRRRFGWGFHSWGCNWRGHNVTYNHDIYVSRSPIFYHRFPGGGGNLGRGPDGFSSRSNNRPADFTPNRGGVFPGTDPRLPPGVHDRDPTLPPGVRNRNPTFPPRIHDSHDFRGFGQLGPNTGTRSGAFSGIGPGGIERGFGSRGRDSFGRGDGFGGGGGMRGGGGHGGGRH